MFAYTVMNSKERKRLLQALSEQYGCDTDTLKEWTFLWKEKDGRINVSNRETAEALVKGDVRVDSAGLYIATMLDSGELRLSIEGSQLVGPLASRNVLEFDDAEFAAWIRGREVEKETELEGFVIIRHGADFCGCGKVVLDQKTGKTVIHNYIPKTRYVRSDD